MDDIFEPFSNLSLDNIQKMDEITCPNCGSVIKSQFMEQMELKNGSNVYCKRENYEYVELC